MSLCCMCWGLGKRKRSQCSSSDFCSRGRLQVSLSSPSPRRTELFRDQEKVTGTMTHVVVSTPMSYGCTRSSLIHTCIFAYTQTHTPISTHEDDFHDQPEHPESRTRGFCPSQKLNLGRREQWCPEQTLTFGHSHPSHRGRGAFYSFIQ